MDSVSSRERLYEIFADTESDTETKICRALDIGVDYFGLSIGFFTRITDGRQEIVHATGDHDRIRAGASCPLEDAYCQQTVDIDGVMAVQDVRSSPIPQRAVDAFDLGSYIGTKVVVDDEVYGTVCFAATDDREQPFSETKELFLELLGRLVSTALERQRYEQQIEAQNERLRTEKQRFEGIAENSSDILFRVGTDGQFTYVSSAVERILGYEPSDLTGNAAFDYVTDAVVERAASAHSRVLSGDEIDELELEFVDESGDVVVLEVNATPISDDGEIVGAQGVGRDITARKAQERELQIKNRAMDEAEVGISIVDPNQPNDPLIYANEGFARLTGYDTAAVIGQNCRFLQGEETDPESIDRFRDAIDSGEPATIELLNYRNNGVRFWNRVQINPVFDETRDVQHFVGFQTDVTERRRTEQLVKLLNRVLRHNLRNGMAAIGGSAASLRDADREQIRESGDRIERICRELTDLSEHARELERYARRDRRPQRLDPGELLTDLVDDHREQSPDATLSLDIETDRGLCAGVELREALSELLENAVKHNPDTDPSVDITARTDGEWIQITVADDGPGINEMEAEAINTGNETALEHGSGLGLWLVNWIVTRYGGLFHIDSSEGEGTVATVRLPVIDDAESVDEAARGPTVLFS